MDQGHFTPGPRSPLTRAATTLLNLFDLADPAVRDRVDAALADLQAELG